MSNFLGQSVQRFTSEFQYVICGILNEKHHCLSFFDIIVYRQPRAGVVDGRAGGMVAEELEPLRKDAWTWSHGRVHEGIAWGSYDIAFKTREEFEAAWPYILKLHGKGVSVTLLRGPHVRVWKTRPAKSQTAGVRIMFSTKMDKKRPPKIKLEKTTFSKTGGVFATECTVRGIELVVDGKIVDLNRIRLPAGTQIIDKRFPERQCK